MQAAIDQGFARTFLRAISTASSGAKAEFIGQLVAPLGLVFRAVSHLGTRHDRPRVQFLGRAVSYVLLLGAPVLSYCLPAYGYIAWAAGAVANLFVLLLCLLFAGFHFDASDSYGQMADEFKQHARTVEAMLGERMWAGRQTRELLLRLCHAEEARSKWVLVNFLKEVTDRLLVARPGTSRYEVSTTKPWPETDYSLFLSENMLYARHIWWLTDPSDFFYKLLPDFVSLALASLACQKHNGHYTVSLQEDADILLTQLFRALEPGLVPALRPGAKVRLPTNDKGTCVRSLRDLVLPVQSQGGICFLALRQKEAAKILGDPTALFEGYRQSCASHLEQVLPHVAAFRNARAAKRRYIYLGMDVIAAPESGQKDLLPDAITKSGWSRERFLEACCERELCCLRLLGETDLKTVVRAALSLFARAYGGEEYCGAVACSADHLDLPEYKDVGIYDERFVVKSEPEEEVGDVRKVTWSYYPDGERPSQAWLFTGSTPNVWTRPYADLREAFLERF